MDNKEVIKCKCGKCPKIFLFTTLGMFPSCEECYEKDKAISKVETFDIPSEFKGIFLSLKEK